MVGVVWCGESGEFLRMSHPIEVAGIHDCAAHAGAVTVHIFGGGMRDDVHAILEWTTVDWCGERVIDDQWHAVAVRCVRELFEIKNDERRIGDGFAEDRLGVRLECRCEFFLGAVRAYERAFDAHFAHGHVDEVERASVDCGGCNDVVTVVADVEECEKVCRLPG